MATIIGQPYDHIDIVNGSNTVRHKLKDVMLRDDLSDIITIPTTLDNWYVGQYYNTPSSVTTIDLDTRTNSSTFNCQYTECQPGDVFYITAVGGSGGKLWVWADASYNILDRAASNATGTDLKLVAPANAAYLIVNVQNTTPYELKDFRRSMKVSLVFDTVAAMQAFDGLQHGMTVRCIGYNSKTDGLGAYYYISNDVSEYAYTGRVNTHLDSLFAIPLLPISKDNNKPNGVVTDLVRLAETYQGSGQQFIYARDTQGNYDPTAFDDDYVAGTYYINCSTLSRLMLYGIDYANSKYGGGTNTHGEGYMSAFETQFTFSSGPVAAAHEQALYFAYKGMAYEPNSDFSNIRVGDLCFFSNAVADNNAVYKSIDHVAIFLGAISGVDASGNTLYMFIGNNGGQSYRNMNTFFYVSGASYMNKIKLCAGFEKPLVQEKPEQIVADPYTKRTSTIGASTIYQYAVNKELESYKWYTFVVDVDEVFSGLNMDFRVNNTARYFVRYGEDNNHDPKWSSTVRPTKTHNVYHLMTQDLSGLTEADRKIIRAYRNPTDSNTISITQFKVYDGWV